jgi:N-acyl-D-amino-acid deacylase
MISLLIRNATLYDGTGAPGVRADLAVENGRIAAIGKIDGPAKETIDAEGLALMPGIIDNHTHYDAQLTWDPCASPSPALGVTTAIIGNCGFTIAPCKPADREQVMKNLTQVEGMGLETLRAGVRWDFESFPEYLDLLERQGTALNIAAFVGHSSIRTFVMGEDAPKREATAKEVAEMRAIVVEAMQAGAIGFATSTSPAHNGHGGLPMPSRLASEGELRTLVTSLKDGGRGVFMLTKGGQSTPAFLESLAAESGRPVVVAALLHNPTNPSVVFDELDAISAANGRGRTMMGAISCCPLSFDFTLESPYPIESLAAWKPAFALKGEARKAKIAEPAFRQSIRDELSRPAQVRNFNGEWDKVQVVETFRPEHAKYEQRTLAELAAEAGKDPLDFFFDLALAEDLQTVFVALTLNSDEEAVGRLIRHPYSLVSLSDAGAHLTFFNDAGFGLHLLGHWVRGKGELSLEQAIYRLTGQTAKLFGIHDRGTLEVGKAADLLLFDPKTVDRGPKERVRDLPAGGARLTTRAVGVQGVWVNGERVADRDGLVRTQRLPGKLLRDFAPA